MGTWYDSRTDEWIDYDPPTPDVTVTPNPIIATLLDANGNVNRTWAERPPIGYR